MSYLVGLPEVGLPESISHQEVPPQSLCIICTVYALLDSFLSQVLTKVFFGIMMALMVNISRFGQSCHVLPLNVSGPLDKSKAVTLIN